MNHDRPRFAFLFTRTGHLTMLSLDRYDAGELDDGARRSTEAHIETCPECRQRFDAVQASSLSLMPPSGEQHETGSATIGTLAVSGGMALAAGLIATIGATLWPDPRVIRQAESGTVTVASAYTSVAQEYSELQQPTLAVARRGGRLQLHASDDATVAVVIVEDDADGGTGGELEAIARIVLAPQPADATDPIEIPKLTPSLRLFAIACTEPVVLVVGDPLPSDEGCAAVEVEAAPVDERDS